MEYTLYAKTKREIETTDSFEIEANSLEEAIYIFKHNRNSDKISWVDCLDEEYGDVIEEKIEAIYDDKNQSVY